MACKKTQVIWYHIYDGKGQEENAMAQLRMNPLGMKKNDIDSRPTAQSDSPPLLAERTGLVDNARWVRTRGKHPLRNTCRAGTEVDRQRPWVLEGPAAAGAEVAEENSKTGQARVLYAVAGEPAVRPQA